MSFFKTFRTDLTKHFAFFFINTSVLVNFHSEEIAGSTLTKGEILLLCWEMQYKVFPRVSVGKAMNWPIPLFGRGCSNRAMIDGIFFSFFTHSLMLIGAVSGFEIFPRFGY